jgi:hypothetical protein
MAQTSSGRLIKTSAQFTPEQLAGLTEEARATGETVAAVLRGIVRKWLAAKARAASKVEAA